MEISSDFLTALCVEAIHGLDGLQQMPTYHTNSHEIDRILIRQMAGSISISISICFHFYGLLGTTSHILLPRPSKLYSFL